MEAENMPGGQKLVFDRTEAVTREQLNLAQQLAEEVYGSTEGMILAAVINAVAINFSAQLMNKKPVK